MSPLSFALLGSGEFEAWTEEADRWLLERAVAAGAGNGSVLILPAASAPEGDQVFDRWADMGMTHYRALGIPAEVVPIKNRDDADRPELVGKLEGASMAFFSGGNPGYLADVLIGSAFWKALLQAMERGLAYAGCSAGIACLGDVAPDSTSNDPTSAHFWRPGLGLFPKLFFGPHWDALDVYVPGLRASIVAAIFGRRRSRRGCAAPATSPSRSCARSRSSSRAISRLARRRFDDRQ